jgi:hypothetical protein
MTGEIYATIGEISSGIAGTYAWTGATCVRMCENFTRTGATMPLERSFGPTGARSPVIAAS